MRKDKDKEGEIKRRRRGKVGQVRGWGWGRRPVETLLTPPTSAPPPVSDQQLHPSQIMIYTGRVELTADGDRWR